MKGCVVFMDFEEMRKKIKERRKYLGMTQEDLASKTNLSVMSIRRYESGDRTPTLDAVERIASALQCELSDLATTAEEGQLTINKVKQLFDDSAKADQKRQKAAEDAVGGDYLVYLANFLIQNADVLAMLQDAGYKIEVTGRASACIQSGPIKYMMTTSDLVERISRFSKAMEGLVSSFPEMRKEADDDAPQDNP